MSKAADGPGFALGVLSRTWSRVEAGDVDAVHRSRVATRRLREALPLVKGRGRERRRLRRELRSVTRSLGPIRELDVALSLAGTLAIAFGFVLASLNAMRVGLQAPTIREAGAPAETHPRDLGLLDARKQEGPVAQLSFLSGLDAAREDMVLT